MSVVSGRMLAFLLRAAEQRGIEPAALLEGLPVDPSRLDRRGARVEWDPFCTVVERLERACGGAQGLVELGRTLASDPVLGPGFQRLFGIAVGPLQLYRLAVRWQGPRDFPNTTSELRVGEGGVLLVAIRLRDGERPCPGFFHLTSGAFEAAPRMLGLGHARVEATIEGREGRYRITPPPSRSLLARAARSLGLLRGASAAIEELEAQHEELRVSEERIRRLAENSRDVIAEWGEGSRCLYVTPGIARFSGSAEAFRERPFERVHPEDREPLARAMALRLERGGSGESTFRMQGVDDEWRWLESVGSAFTTPEGERRVITVMRDVTERRALEEQLQYSQKMEAVGRLAGGLAHDFNNLLTIIAACADLLEPAVQDDAAAAETRERIVEATQRAGAVTRQLLAIARGQVVETEVLDLNEVVARLDPLVRRSLRGDVELVLRLAPEAGRVRAERSQIEQVILNLAINARDAMPRGGRLEIGTGRIEGGEAKRVGLEEGVYSVLRVRDEGVGMDHETRTRAFDPFFSTKSVGRGSGLGLAVVFGIARQAGGTARIESAPGAGTTVSVLLPATDEPATVRRPSPRGEGRGAGERLLLLEDDATVRQVCQEGLTRLGYEVAAVAGADEARRHLTDDAAPVRLLIADLVMRRGGGAELAAELADRHPALPVLFISGQGSGAVPPLRTRDGLLEKPFSLASLGRAVRELIDAG